MPHFYELSTQYQNLLAWLESDQPIDENSLRQQLSEVTEQLKEKAENIGKMVLEYEANTVSIDIEITRLSSRKKSLVNKIEWLKSYVQGEMQNAQIDKIPGQILTLSLRSNPPSVKVLDETQIPAQFFRIIPETKEVNKSAILTEFKKTGEIQPGTEIITDKKSLVIK